MSGQCWRWCCYLKVYCWCTATTGERVHLFDANADTYALQVGEVHLLVLHPHHADRDHLLDILPPPLHLLPIQVGHHYPKHNALVVQAKWTLANHGLKSSWFVPSSGQLSLWQSSCSWSTSSQALNFPVKKCLHEYLYYFPPKFGNYLWLIFPQELWMTLQTQIMEVRLPQK